MPIIGRALKKLIKESRPTQHSPGYAGDRIIQSLQIPHACNVPEATSVAEKAPAYSAGTSISMATPL